jgi:hypothetical protein
MTTTTAQPTTNQTGEPVELARYQADVGERILIGQRVDGRARVTDEPAAGNGRRYLIEAYLESKDALDALIADYLEKARRLGYVPMHGWF